jgi:hypothetical protein
MLRVRAYAGRTLTVLDPYSHTKTRVYDVTGKPRNSTDAMGSGYTVTRSYYTAVTLNGITDSAGNSLLFDRRQDNRALLFVAEQY